MFWSSVKAVCRLPKFAANKHSAGTDMRQAGDISVAAQLVLHQVLLHLQYTLFNESLGETRSIITTCAAQLAP